MEDCRSVLAIDRVGALRATKAGRDGQQVQIVVAENGDRALTQCDDVAQRGKGLGTAIDQVAGEPERRVVGGGQFGEQVLKRRAAALEVAESDWRGRALYGHIAIVAVGRRNLSSCFKLLAL